MFPSSRNTAKLSDFGDKAEKGAVEGKEGDEPDAPRSRFFERSSRKSMNEKDGRDNRESWTSVRERRTQAGDDDHKDGGKFGRRDREQDSERRLGFGDKQDGRWSERQIGRAHV